MADFRKISANYIYTGPGKWLKNGIIIVNNSHEILEVIDTGGNLKESAGLEFYNGLIIPGWTTLITDGFPSDCKYSGFFRNENRLVASGCRNLVSLTTHKIKQKTTLSGGSLTIYTLRQIPVSSPSMSLHIKSMLKDKSVSFQLYAGPAGMILHVHIRENLKENVLPVISELSGKHNAGIIFTGELSLLRDIVPMQSNRQAWYLISAEQLLRNNRIKLKPGQQWTEHICLYLSHQTKTYPDWSVSAFLKILENQPDISFMDMVGWITANPAMAFGFGNKKGRIQEGYQPGLVLVSPFNFEKMSLLPQSRFTVLDQGRPFSLSASAIS